MIAKLPSFCVLVAGFSFASASATLADSVACTVLPSEQASITFAASGIISEIKAERGDAVQAGQLLARLDSGAEETAQAIADFRMQQVSLVHTAQSKLKLAATRLARAGTLFKKGTASQGNLDEAQAEYDAAEMELESQKDQKSLDTLEAQRTHRLLERRNLRSPMAGVVVDRLFSIGEYVDQQKVFTIAKLDPLTVEIRAPADLFGSVRTGDKVSVVLERPKGDTVSATVTNVDGLMEPATATFSIRATVPNPDKSIVAGYSCKAVLPASPG